jgi:hypothetical protein
VSQSGQAIAGQPLVLEISATNAAPVGIARAAVALADIENENAKADITVLALTELAT